MSLQKFPESSKIKERRKKKRGGERERENP